MGDFAQQRIKGKSKISPNCLRQLLLSVSPYLRQKPKIESHKRSTINFLEGVNILYPSDTYDTDSEDTSDPFLVFPTPNLF